jgi:hypothetical protein
MTDTTGDKIVKAREEERNRITRSRPVLTTKLGFDGLAGQSLPVLEIKIVGGDPEKLTALGLKLQGDVLAAMPGLVLAESGDED